MQHTARFFASRVERFTLVLPKSLESQFPEVAENQPELLARHCTEAGLIEKAAGLWGKADNDRSNGRRWLRPASSLRVRSIRSCVCLQRLHCVDEADKLQVALITPLIHVKGYAAPETKAAAERARLLIEQAGSARGTSRRPVAAVLSPLQLLGRKLCCV